MSVIADTGCTGHFLTINATGLINVRPSATPLVVQLPDGTTMSSSHIAELNIPQLPVSACTVHLFPALGDTSLLSIGQLCDAGCTATFTDSSVTISHSQSGLILTGRRDAHSNLWTIDLPSKPTEIALAVNDTKKPADIVAFAHAALFSPSLSTLQKALNRNYVVGFPGLTPQTLRRHPPKSIATIKGHLDQSRQNQRSTAKPPPGLPLLPVDEDDDSEEALLEDAFPTPNSGSNERTNLCYTACLPTLPTGQIFTDQTGRFIVPASTGNTQLFILYDYDSNSIHAEPMPNKTSGSILAAYKRVHNVLVTAGLRPKLQRLDNECSEALKEFMTEQDIDFQRVPPGIHRANAAERAIRTFKNHFIAGLCSTDRDFPLHLWDRLVHQATLSLNIMRGSRLNPNLSAWAQVYGHYNFNRTPIAPPGIRVLVHEKPDNRASWAPHALDGWYVGPAMENYRCYRCWMWDTHRERIADTVTWFPQHVAMPIGSSTDLVIAGANDIIKALQHPSPGSALSPLEDSEVAVLHALADILLNRKPQDPASIPTVLPPATLPALQNAPQPQHQQQPEQNPQTNTPPPAEDHTAPLLRVVPTPEPPVTYADASAPKPRRSRRPKKPTTKQLENDQHRHRALGTSPNEAASLPPHTKLIADTTPTNATAKTPHHAYTAIHPDTGDPAEYQKLLKSSDGHLWEQSSIEEWARLAQGCPPANIPESAGTNTLFFIKMKQIPAGKKATYIRIVVADRPQKENTRRVRVTVGGDQIDYPGDVSTKTAGLTTAKILFNSVLSTEDAMFMTMDIKDFYLYTMMARYEYLKIHKRDIPKLIWDHYNLDSLAVNDYVYAEVRRGMYGLPQAGKIANDELIPHLSAYGYVQCKHTPGLFRHLTRPITFCLVVDDFGVKYVGREHAEHLRDCIAAKYKMTTDWTGDVYLGISLQWDYNKRTVGLSMPGYVEKALNRFTHGPPKRPQHAPHAWVQPTYGATTQYTALEDTSAPLNANGIKRLQEIIGVLLYYARAIDSTMLVALGTLASAQTKGTEATARAAAQLLDYAATHPDAVLQYNASDMILHVHSDASYLSEKEARSRAGGLFFLSSRPSTTPDSDPPPPLNGAIHIVSSIMRNVLASATEAEVGALFHNCQDACMLRTTLDEMGHPQPATRVQTDNACAEGIVNNTVRQRRSKAIDMLFYWVGDRVKLGQFIVHWKKGVENRADYFTKHFPPSHHREIRPTYILPGT